jgi:hypothetical protein
MFPNCVQAQTATFLMTVMPMPSACLTLQLKSITVDAVLVSQAMERLVLQILLVVMLSTTATLQRTVCTIKVQQAIGAGAGR